MNKALFRSQSDKIIAGVCGGLADYFEVDSTIVRLLFILIMAIGGSGVLIYLALWLIMPRGPHQPAVINEEKVKELAEEIKDKVNNLKEELKKEEPEKKEKQDKGHGGFFGWLLVALGLVFLANNFMPFWMKAHLANFWPLILVFIGLAVIIGKNK